MSRGNNNLKYETGFQIEAEKFTEYKPILLDTLQAEDIELTTRGMLDKVTGCDATALIDGLVYGVSLRFRSSDYNSFTLNRHITDPYSEVHKWIKPHNTNLKPIYYIQINQRYHNELRLIRVNIEAYSVFLQHLVKTDSLEMYWENKLLAYEFPTMLPNGYKGIFTEVFTQ
ncbi:hypothetical protein [Gillisia sp. JM1]|uniref:hypothetical protein n=1 Tax=Gillisia sp. JM1 TaxID=1283286 RepID=UPI0004270E83|nr:hypothetical protein [Gillisia sp. JM1]